MKGRSYAAPRYVTTSLTVHETGRKSNSQVTEAEMRKANWRNATKTWSRQTLGTGQYDING